MDKNEISLSSLQVKLDQLGISDGGGGTPALLENNFFVGDSSNQAVGKNVSETKTILNISNVTDNTLNTKIDKIQNPTPSNIPIIDATGQLVDSGINTATLKDGWDGEVNTFADLPAASNNDGKKYVVKTPSGVIGINKKYAGTYISDGSTWNIFGYKQASVINQPLTGYIIASSTSDLNSSDTILNAFQKLQKQNKDINASNINYGTLNKDRLPVNMNAIALKDNNLYFRGDDDSNHLIHYNSSDDGVELKTNGAFTVSTHFVVTGSFSKYITNYGYLTSAGNIGSSPATTASFAAWFQDRIIVSGEVDVLSDIRLKEIIGVSNTKEDLNDLLKIEITRYTLKYEEKKVYKKVIAQQLEKIAPSLVSKVKNFVHDIELATHIESKKLVIDTEEHQIRVNDKLRIVKDKKNYDVIVTALFKNYAIINTNLGLGDCYVMGKEVDDCRVVDYDGLTTLAVSAMQELNKTVEELKTTVESLKQEVKQMRGSKFNEK